MRRSDQPSASAKRSPPSARLVLAGAAIAVSTVAFAPGCGSRGPLDINVVDPDASAQPTVDASLEDASEVKDSAPPPHDAKSDAPFALDSGIPILDCGACVFGNCQTQLIACISNQACQQTLGCVVQTCLAGGGGGGGFNPQCLQTCGSDPASTAAALRVLTCILNNCGNTCIGALGGLGGGGPGGGGSGGGGGGGGGSGGGSRDGG